MTIPLDVDRYLETKRQLIIARAGDTVSGVLEIGKHLNDAKRSIEPGRFMSWLDTLPFAYQTATAYMRIAEVFGEYRREDIGRFTVEALKTLSASIVEEESRQRVLSIEAETVDEATAYIELHAPEHIKAAVDDTLTKRMAREATAVYRQAPEPVREKLEQWCVNNPQVMRWLQERYNRAQGRRETTWHELERNGGVLDLDGGDNPVPLAEANETQCDLYAQERQWGHVQENTRKGAVIEEGVYPVCLAGDVTVWLPYRYSGQKVYVTVWEYDA